MSNGHQNGNESHYDLYSNGINGSSTLGRPSRQRQISQPIPVPPPPKEEIKKKEHKKSMSSKSLGSQSLSGTLIRPRPIHPAHMAQAGRHPPPMFYGPPPPPNHHMIMGTLPHHMNGQAHNGRQFHTIGYRGHGPPPPGPHHQMMQMQMPHGPMMHMPQQYATLQSVKKQKKKKGKDKMNGSIPVGVPMVPPPMFYPPPPNGMMDSPRALGMNHRKMAQSTAALDDSGNSGAESPGGTTGIYRRKGHLNERAFSYSIRQEHRSRSHGSLASLQFSPPDMKKEREIIQMVSGLELHDESTLRRHGNGREMMTNGAGTFGKPRR